MRILGVNSGRAAPTRCDPARRRWLADGSAAVLVDGRVGCAAIEERHSLIRYAGGFAHAAPAALDASAVALENLDGVGFSSCCDSPWNDERDRLEEVVEELAHTYDAKRIHEALAGKVHCVNHHDSHAALAFIGSGYHRALVCVIDGFGNRIDDTEQFHVNDDWWRGSFERQTLFLAEWREGRVALERVHQGAIGRDEIGLAELYRAVTHYLGWPSYQYCGKTMALASYGEPSRFQRLRLAEVGPDDHLRVLLDNRHDNPVGLLEAALRKAGYNPPRTLMRPATPTEPFLTDLAGLLQEQFERTLIEFIGRYADMLQTPCVAFAGGGALNCIALGKLARARPDLELYVPPAPGDTGQGLGNALWLAYAEGSPLAEMAAPQPLVTAALGPRTTIKRVADTLEQEFSGQAHFKVTKLSRPSELARAAATLVAGGRAIALRVGGSEYGPRALGHCSIIADPRDPEAQWKVNQVKHREAFRPFAASVLEGHRQQCFPGAPASPFMSFAARASEFVRTAAPGIVHVDGTTRYQSVAAEQGLFGAILTEFQRQTGLPLILNTSFNMAGEPMAETPENAIDVFKRSGLDALVLEDVLITRN